MLINKPLKILMINDVGTAAGGAETMIVHLKNALTHKGHTVEILTGQDKASVRLFSDYTYRSFTDSSFKRFLFFIYNPYSAIKLKKILKNYKPDIVHLHNIKKASSSILFLLKNYPTVMTAHDLSCVDQTAFDSISSLAPYKESLANYFIYTRSISYYVQKLRFKVLKSGQKNIDIIISPSIAMSNVLKQARFKSQISIIYNGVVAELNNKRVAETQHTANILYVGRILEEKGIGILLDAVEMALTQNSKIHLTICGDGPYMVELKMIAEKKKLLNNITFTGLIKHSQIHSYILKSNLIVVPSICFESLGLVAVESLLMRRPVIVTASGGLTEVVTDGRDGIIVPRNDANAISLAILRILNENQFMINANNNERVIKMFSMELYTKKTLDLYKIVIDSYL